MSWASDRIDGHKNAETLKVERPTQGARVGGRRPKPTYTALSPAPVGLVAPMGQGSDVAKMLPEGQRHSGNVEIYTATELLAGNGSGTGDRLERGNSYYEVTAVAEWPGPDGSKAYACAAVKMKERPA